MPVTAKLSKQFYDRFGEDVTNELVNWFNAVDATYRGELRDLNGSNFARFDAKMGERVAELRGSLRAEMAQLETRLGERLTELRDDLRTEVAQVTKAMSQLETKLADRLGQVKSDLLKWLVTFWLSTLIGLGALFFRG